jgi:glutamate/tyrosine decarboxylase-like PLP-dependent enzyme
VSDLSLTPEARSQLWTHLVYAIEDYIQHIPSHRATADLDVDAIRTRLQALDFTNPMSPLAAVDFAVENLWRHQVHAPHPRYFGLFNPNPTTMGIAADFLAAAFNPQLAAWSHSPFANEVEPHLVRAFGGRFGYEPEHTDGCFTSGGAEANHTAVLTALAYAFPEFRTRGVRALPADPVFYVSAEAHHSFQKAARLCGLGTDAVREVPVDLDLRMRPRALTELIVRDKVSGLLPFLVVATAGTTNAGAVDPIGELAGIAAGEKLWLHVDAAWGGAAALVPELRPLLAGIERADSITFDAHKWLSVPMAAGLYLTRHPDILHDTFRIPASYMPKEHGRSDVIDPHAHTIQWSRRFIGLKVLLSLLVAGWEGYETVIRHQTTMGERLRIELAAGGWRVVNRTPLPVVCFVDDRHAEGTSFAYLDRIAKSVFAGGKCWISTTRLGGTTPVLRACVTNHRTQVDDLHALVAALEEARHTFLSD